MTQRDTCPIRATDFDGIANLKDDILWYGGEINKCDVHIFGDGMRGIIATQDIQDDEEIMFIPEAFLI